MEKGEPFIVGLPTVAREVEADVESIPCGNDNCLFSAPDEEYSLFAHEDHVID